MNNNSKNTVYISNLSYDRDRNGLKSLFMKFGQIKNIKIIVEPTTNQSRGMAFVEMSSALEAKNAIEALDQTRLDGRTVKAKYATPLKTTSMSRAPEKKEKNKDLAYVSKQLAKKARNDKKRKSNLFIFKSV
jgi:RNA recognition motif-containing protein